MASFPVIVAATSSTIVRLAAYGFLRWIPGHHFPPIILTAVAVYLACVFGKSEAFGPSRPTLAETFPKLFPTETQPHAEERTRDNIDDDHHEPILYEDEKTILKTLFLGIPNWREADYTYISILINILLAVCTLDLVFRGPLLHPAQDLRFSRVGYVDSTSAKVLFREPDSAHLPVYAYLKSDTSTWTTTDRIYYLGADTDYTYPLSFTGLAPATTYVYSLSNDLSGTFTTVPASNDARSNKLTFLTSSCIKANFPYQPISHALSIRGFESLFKVVRSLPTPAAFMLFLGDFIYVDVPLRLSSSFAHYRSEYRRVYASPSWHLPGLSSLPWIHTLDDHEIANDWSGGNDTAPFPAASDPFIHYHVSVNPPIPASAPSGPDTNTTYFQFTQGPASFFMLDTRRYRTAPEPPSHSQSLSRNNHTMLGASQLQSLLTFLSAPPSQGVHWKIIASSVPFTKNWRFGTPDTWGGFLSERAVILAAMHTAERELGVRCIVLSGDRHEFAAVRYPPPILNLSGRIDETSHNTNPTTGNPGRSEPDEAGQGNRIVYDRTPNSGPHEFSVGPLSMFYLPFRTFKQIDDEDVAIQYLPDGNSKIGVVEIQNLEGNARTFHTAQKSMLKYSLWINGEVQWEYVLSSPGVGFDGGGGGLSGGSGLGLRDWIGRRRRKDGPWS